MPSPSRPVLAEAALDLLPDGVLVVADGRVALANRHAERLIGAPLRDTPSPGWLPRADGEHGLRLPAAPGEARRRAVTVTCSPCALPDGRAARLVLLRDRSAQEAREAELVRLAHRDGLTGLLNQRSFRERLAEEVGRLSRHGRPLGLIVVDLDHFKAVNDDHGHPTGDRVLAEAAGRIAAAARAVDSVGRIGGEEFAWLLPDAGTAQVLAAAQRLRTALRGTPFADGLSLTASFGVAALRSGDAADGSTLLARADQALYWAKGHGRDAVVPWSTRAAERLAAFDDGPGFGALRDAADAADATPGAAHGRRVADLAVALAGTLDWAPDRQARLHQAARVHDAGKALVSAELLHRPGPLGPTEVAHVRQHAALGAGLAEAILDEEQRAWIRHHHERWDGGGYPDGRAAEGIPDGAQLLALADAWDAMTSERPYGAPLTPQAALAEVQRAAGRQFRPGADALVRAALAWWASADAAALSPAAAAPAAAAGDRPATPGG